MSLFRDVFIWLVIKFWKVFSTILILLLIITIIPLVIEFGRGKQKEYYSLKEDYSSKQKIAKEKKVTYEKYMESNGEPHIGWHPYDWNAEWVIWKLTTESKIKELKQELSQADNNSISSKQKLDNELNGSLAIIRHGENAWGMFLGIALCAVFGVFIVPNLWKITWYYFVAPLAKSASAIRLRSAATSQTKVGESAAILEVEIAPGETFYTKADWVNEYSVDGVSKKTKLIWKWQSIFISYAAGLRELTQWTAIGSHPYRLKICNGSDPDVKLIRFDIEDHPGIVLKPCHVVALSGDIKLHTEWKLWSIHSWIGFKFRHIIFSGTGSLFLYGWGDIDAKMREGRSRMDDKLLIAFDSSTPFRAVRTETFWPFLRGKTRLFDVEFLESGLIIHQSSVSSTSTAGGKSRTGRLEGLVDLLLKPLGF